MSKRKQIRKIFIKRYKIKTSIKFRGYKYWFEVMKVGDCIPLGKYDRSKMQNCLNSAMSYKKRYKKMKWVFSAIKLDNGNLNVYRIK